MADSCGYISDCPYYGSRCAESVSKYRAFINYSHTDERAAKHSAQIEADSANN
jgi:hypothetical protein